LDFTLGGFITGAVVTTVISIILNFYWERRKLSRGERASAYADFLSVFSKRWRAFIDRDVLEKATGSRTTAEYVAVDERVDTLRDDLYDAYTRIEILAPREVVALALYCLGVSDARNRQHTTAGQTRGVGNDERTEALNSFVAAARRDVGQNELDLFDLRRKRDAAKLGMHGVDEVLVPYS
jgi:hypothetical protein